jgi:hypothetical protein
MYGFNKDDLYRDRQLKVSDLVLGKSAFTGTGQKPAK